MLSWIKKRNTIRREAAGNAEFPSMRTLREGTDWAGTKGECVAGKGTSMGHWLSNTQEGKSCENVVLPANNWQRDFDDFLLHASAVAPFTLDHSSAERPRHNCINTIITTLRFLFTRLAEAWGWNRKHPVQPLFQCNISSKHSWQGAIQMGRHLTRARNWSRPQKAAWLTAERY